MLISCSAMIISVIIAAERSFWRNRKPYITPLRPVRALVRRDALLTTEGGLITPSIPVCPAYPP